MCIHYYKVNSAEVGVCQKCGDVHNFYRTLAEEATGIGYGRSERKYVKPRHRNKSTGQWTVGNPTKNT